VRPFPCLRAGCLCLRDPGLQGGDRLCREWRCRSFGTASV